MKTYQVTVDGQVYTVTVEEVKQGPSRAVAPAAQISRPAAPAPAPVAAPAPTPMTAAAGGGTLQAPMPGKILSVKVKQGDTVKIGDVILILEAMKMENDIMAPADGKVKAVNVKEGDSVNTGDILIVIES